MPVQFAVLASGSRGNATLVRSAGAGLLVDLGIGPRALADRLASVGSHWDQIASAVLTHTHGDHVDNNTLLNMAKRRVVLYCHEGHRAGLSRHPGFQALETGALVRYYDERPFLTSTGIGIEPLELRHDGATFGFRIEAKPDRRRRSVAIGYVADTGSWSPGMADLLTEVDLLGLEFNHDVEMQRQSGRSWTLIRRNLGDRGHLSNRPGGGIRRGDSRPIEPGLLTASGVTSPEPAMQSSRAGSSHGEGSDSRDRPESRGSRRASEPGSPEPLDRTRSPAAPRARRPG